MPRIRVNGVDIAYEVLGEGPPVVFTPGGRAGLEVTRRLGEQLSSRYQVLIYDRRNCGASDVSIAGSSSEWEIWADDVYALLERLDMSPAYVGGGSSGAVVSLLVAHRHPKDVKGLLLLCPPTDDPEVHESYLHQEMYAQYAELAESKGMQAVVETPYYAERIEQNLANREWLLSMDPKEFATVMTRWNSFPTYGTRYFGLTDEMLQRIATPATIIPGAERDENHPQHIAEKLRRLLPNSELVSRVEFFSPAEMEQLPELAEAWVDGRFQAVHAPIFDDFMKRTEAEQS